MKIGLSLLAAVFVLCGCSKHIVAPGLSGSPTLTKTTANLSTAALINPVPHRQDSLSGIKIVRGYTPFIYKGTPDSVVKTTLTVAKSNGLFKVAPKSQSSTDH